MRDQRKRISVVAAVIIEQQKVFATQRGYGDFKDGWEFPGGKVEAGEKPEDALKREIAEELQTEIEVHALLGTVEYDYPGFHLSMSCYLATIHAGTPVLLEHEAAKWLGLNELYTVDWLPADREIIPAVEKAMLDSGNW